VSDLQDGFTPPFFKLTESILVDAGFDTGTTLLLLRNPRFGTFARVKVGYVVTVKEGEHIFLKALGVVDCAKFDKQCVQFPVKGTGPSRLRNHLGNARLSSMQSSLIS
jgi:hypothetical protein